MLKQIAHIILWGMLCISPAQLAHAEAWDGLSIYRHDAPNLCALTFDDGPSRLTDQLLATLKSLNIHATFFILGIQVEKHPNTMKKIINAGHEVANHGYSHLNFHKISPEAQYAELSKTNILLNELGISPKFFRPAYGKYTSEAEKMAKDLGLTILLWSSDSRDWKNEPVDYANINNIIGRKYKFKEMRGVFLFHDTSKITVDNLPLIVQELYRSGCRKFVTVSEYIEYKHNNIGQLAIGEQENIAVGQPDIAMDKANFDKASPSKASSDKASSDNISTEKISPVKASSEKVSPKKINPTRINADKQYKEKVMDKTRNENNLKITLKYQVPLKRSSTP